MIVDTSAVVAILRREPEAEEFIDALISGSAASMAAPSYLEAAIVLGNVGDGAVSRLLAELITEARIEIVPFTRELADRAHQAYREFGKGSGHRARLNYGDCMSYALAASTGQALLWKGDDFTHTPIGSALDQLD